MRNKLIPKAQTASTLPRDWAFSDLMNALYGYRGYGKGWHVEEGNPREDWNGATWHIDNLSNLPNVNVTVPKENAQLLKNTRWNFTPEALKLREDLEQSNESKLLHLDLIRSAALNSDYYTYNKDYTADEFYDEKIKQEKEKSERVGNAITGIADGIGTAVTVRVPLLGVVYWGGTAASRALHGDYEDAGYRAAAAMAALYGDSSAAFKASKAGKAAGWFLNPGEKVTQTVASRFPRMATAITDITEGIGNEYLRNAVGTAGNAVKTGAESFISSFSPAWEYSDINPTGAVVTGVSDLADVENSGTLGKLAGTVAKTYNKANSLVGNAVHSAVNFASKAARGEAVGEVKDATENSHISDAVNYGLAEVERDVTKAINKRIHF